MVFLTQCFAILCLSMPGKCHGLLQEAESQAQTLESSHYKVIPALGSSRPQSLKCIFQNILEHISKKYSKTVSVSQHEDEDHPSVADHMPKGSFVIPWREVEKEREGKQDDYLGSDVERGNIPICSVCSRVFLALFKTVEILAAGIILN